MEDYFARLSSVLHSGVITMVYQPVSSSFVQLNHETRLQQLENELQQLRSQHKKSASVLEQTLQQDQDSWNDDNGLFGCGFGIRCLIPHLFLGNLDARFLKVARVRVCWGVGGNGEEVSRRLNNEMINLSSL